MDIKEIIAKKRDNKKLNKEEIDYFINEYTNGEITDYQAAALVMAIYVNGMDMEETANLTIAMANSGDILDLSSIGKIVVDKHSTGGVGDKVTLVLAPIIASLGVTVAKMSGRGLGITGGTRDKLESIPGYRTELSIEEFIKNVQEIGICLIGQTGNLAPADKKLYALRDAINCTESIPLIASSIMSKKIASGAQKIVIDVTYGSGAFMKTKEDALNLANIITEIGKNADKETKCILTEMNEPLGYAVGNSLEIIEVVECLKGNMPTDIKKVVIELGTQMLKLAEISKDNEECEKLILESIQNGKALNKFIQLIEKQSGDSTYIKDTSKFEKAKYIMPVIAINDFIIKEINAEEVGKLSLFLGAGREKKEDKIEYNTGIVFYRKVGEKVNMGDTIAEIHANNEQKAKEAVKYLYKLLTNKCNMI